MLSFPLGGLERITIGDELRIRRAEIIKNNIMIGRDLLLSAPKI
jgi:hypothetical protein